jgi:hypothetical protein
MNWVHDLQIDRLANYAQANVSTISWAMATSVLVIAAAPLNRLVASVIGRWNFFLRTVVYIALFTFGYTQIAWWTERILRSFLGDQKPLPLLVLVVLAFAGFGIWASSQKNLRS